ncbi:arginase [Sporolactobacillus sp. THM7-4]|nr:arginase [Sporolactobacillus sp. THM7-4]
MNKRRTFMSLLHHGITFLDFDGLYNYQNRLTSSLPHRWADLRWLRGTSLYCSPDAFRVIREKLRSLPDKGLTFLGSGNYHYAALALLEEIRRPFTLVLFDHHTDLNEGQIGSLLSCGSWVCHAVKGLPKMKRAIIIGPQPLSIQNISGPFRHQVIVIPENHMPSDQRILSLIPADTIYISIDKDVLSPQFARTNWDQGHLTLDTLCRLIRLLTGSKETAGIDICGEWPIRPHEQLNSAAKLNIRINEKSNLVLARMIAATLSRSSVS